LNTDRPLTVVRAWPVAVLLGLQLAVYAAMSGRGFEYTDEAFNLLNALHWREFTATYTLFGAYLEAPLHALGDSLTAMRLLSPLALVVTGGLLGLEVRSSLWGREAGPGALPTLLYALLGAIGSMYYFSFFMTLRVPSYNLISLCAAMLSTALLLRCLAQPVSQSALPLALTYGFTVGACGFAKATTGLLTVMLHVVFMLCVHRDWSWRGFGGLLVAALLGLGLQVGLVTLLHPDWLASLQAGVSLFSYDNGGKLGGMFNDFRWDMQRLAHWAPAAAVGLTAWWALAHLSLQKDRLRWMTLAAVPMVLVLSLFWIDIRLAAFWWPAALICGLLLATLQVCALPRSARRAAICRELPYWLLFLLLPFAFSFGTSMSVLWHSRSAAVFVVLLLVIRLDALSRLGLLTRPALTLCVTLLCVSPLWFQLHSLVDYSGTYRLAHPLLAQTQTIQTPLGEVKVDPQTHADLTALISTARQAGLRPGMGVLDFTGDGPGRVLVVGARPVGVPWLVGGYPESPRWAERLIGMLKPEVVSGAWIMSSPDGPRTIAAWHKPLVAKLGPSSHEVAAVVRLGRSAGMSANGDGGPITLCLWRPRVSKLIDAQPANASVCLD